MAQRIEIVFDIITHATEDFKKISNTLKEFFDIDEKEISSKEIFGHHGNPILFHKAKIRDLKKNEKIVKTILKKLPKFHKEQLLENLEEWIPDSILLIRISKQEFVQGKIILEDKDAIKIKITIPSYKKSKILENYRSFLKEFDN